LYIVLATPAPPMVNTRAKTVAASACKIQSSGN
jgi:hypothetical protein